MSRPSLLALLMQFRNTSGTWFPALATYISAGSVGGHVMVKKRETMAVGQTVSAWVPVPGNHQRISKNAHGPSW